MCELFAANSKRPQTLNAQLETFFGDSVMHPHGWGLATRETGGPVELVKGPGRAIDSLECARVLASPIAASHALAHIRYATKGSVAYDNCHPFLGCDVTGVEWSFVHNGSVFHPESIESFDELAVGDSDSERVMLYLLDAVNGAARSGKRGFDARFTALAEALAVLSPGNKVNAILDDGEFTYVYTNTADDTLFSHQGNEAALFCTRPLDKSAWAPVPKRRLLAYRDGSLVAASQPKACLYHLNQAELDAFLLANAA